MDWEDIIDFIDLKISQEPGLFLDMKIDGDGTINVWLNKENLQKELLSKFTPS